MNTMIPFNYGNHEVRVIKDEFGTIWMVAKDACEILSIRTDTVNAILDNDEFSNTNTIGIKIDGVNRGLTIINEPGLYSLIFKSRKPEAKQFKRWVTHEVLPQIRKTGKDEMPGVGLMDEEAKKSNMMHYSVAGLCQEADKYLGGKAALTALNYFTGMPVDELMAELETQKAATASPGQSVSKSVAAYVKDCCILDPDAEVFKSDISADYDRYCSDQGLRNVGYDNFFRELYKIGNISKTRKSRGYERIWCVRGIAFKPCDALAPLS